MQARRRTVLVRHVASLAAAAFVVTCSVAYGDTGPTACPSGLKTVRSPTFEEYYPRYQACWGVTVAATIELGVGVSGRVDTVNVRDVRGTPAEKQSCVVAWLSDAFRSVQLEAPGAACIKVIRFKTVLKS